MDSRIISDAPPYIQHTDILMSKMSNRYRVVVAVARRAKQKEYWDDEPEVPTKASKIKSISRTIKEMADELMLEDTLSYEVD
ncbi:DNA-directed RNA polymerase, omega subunit [Xenococcus sp. PCC 7305]|uniref:DNA-directed RNA polymerase subunit omega n=1 Tax=Xenococcus sp. PCC 7305 TaxID=102125 RepID=UPI0002ABDC62|nr:DNA-directed RNA polymerase subunit omega [Xenococcus sp. PCC 7305]ELS03966.1 DNA-directed RNA polymerase, omega subunit [Xenococcus sp. PCC 7305]